MTNSNHSQDNKCLKYKVGWVKSSGNFDHIFLWDIGKTWIQLAIIT